MRFYNREAELGRLERMHRLSLERSSMTVVTGRRRVGKTRLIRESLKSETYLYFFVSRKTEELLCQEFVAELHRVLGETVPGRVTEFGKLFRYLMELSTRQPIRLVIDEFQEFFRINPSVYGDIQNHWDNYRDRSSMQLVLSGSVCTLMNRIFTDAREPLFGRADTRLHIRPLSPDWIPRILEEAGTVVTPELYLGFYQLTGGVPLYLEHYVDLGLLSFDAAINELLQSDSLFLNEGVNVLIQEFGKDYGVYFSILSLLAAGFTTRTKIESVLQRDIGGHLARLEKEYRIIKARRPIFAKPNARQVKYYIDDNFLNFWFRFIYKYRSLVEMERFSALREIIDRDYRTFAGHTLEKLIRTQLAASGRFTQVGNYWEAGNRNEIDVVAVDESSRTALIGEVKWQRDKVSPSELKEKAQKLVAKHLRGYEIEFRAFGLEDIPSL